MIREFPDDWTPQWPPPPQTRFEQFIDDLFMCCPYWDQVAILILFVAYLCAMGALIVHLA